MNIATRKNAFTNLGYGKYEGRPLVAQGVGGGVIGQGAGDGGYPQKGKHNACSLVYVDGSPGIYCTGQRQIIEDLGLYAFEPRYSGTPSGTGILFHTPENNNGIPCSRNQVNRVLFKGLEHAIEAGIHWTDNNTDTTKIESPASIGCENFLTMRAQMAMAYTIIDPGFSQGSNLLNIYNGGCVNVYGGSFSSGTLVRIRAGEIEKDENGNETLTQGPGVNNGVYTIHGLKVDMQAHKQGDGFKLLVMKRPAPITANFDSMTFDRAPSDRVSDRTLIRTMGNATVNVIRAHQLPSGIIDAIPHSRQGIAKLSFLGCRMSGPLTFTSGSVCELELRSCIGMDNQPIPDYFGTFGAAMIGGAA